MPDEKKIPQRKRRPRALPRKTKVWRRKRPKRKIDTLKRTCSFLQRWLRSHARIRMSIKWQNNDGVRVYDQWPPAQKQDLCRMYWKLARGKPLNLSDVPVNLHALQDSSFPETSISPSDAWNLYLSYVAASLIAELKSEVLWSIEDYSDEDIKSLLDATLIFTYDAAANQYRISVLNNGYVLPSPSNLLKPFIYSNQIIGNNPIDSIGNLLEYCRTNLRHFSGPSQARNFENHWQYRGLVPVTRILSGTTFNGVHAHYTAGCHGTNGFLKTILRLINIPCIYFRPANVGHATPRFPTANVSLTHGDDPYNQLTYAVPAYPASELLVPDTLFDEWFSPDLTNAEERTKNIGRQTRELALIHLPNLLLHDYCTDMAEFKTHATGRVFQYFARWYTVETLEALGLWTRMDSKIASIGGCENVRWPL